MYQILTALVNDYYLDDVSFIEIKRTCRKMYEVCSSIEEIRLRSRMESIFRRREISGEDDIKTAVFDAIFDTSRQIVAISDPRHYICVIDIIQSGTTQEECAYYSLDVPYPAKSVPVAAVEIASEGVIQYSANYIYPVEESNIQDIARAYHSFEWLVKDGRLIPPEKHNLYHHSVIYDA